MDFAENLANKHKYIDTWLASGIGLKNEAHQCNKELGYEITGFRFVNLF
ncbi:hypothetical protein M1D47_01865 [Bacillus sp. R1-10]